MRRLLVVTLLAVLGALAPAQQANVPTSALMFFDPGNPIPLWHHGQPGPHSWQISGLGGVLHFCVAGRGAAPYWIIGVPVPALPGWGSTPWGIIDIDLTAPILVSWTGTTPGNPLVYGSYYGQVPYTQGGGLAFSIQAVVIDPALSNTYGLTAAWDVWR